MPYYYLVIFGLLTLCAVFEAYRVNTRAEFLMRVFAFFLVFVTAACKYETGVDWRVYERIYDAQEPISAMWENGVGVFFSGPRFELGYVLLMAVLKWMGGGAQLLYAVIALVNIILLYKSLTYFSRYPLLCLLGYYSFIFFILDMSGIRQALALNLLLYGMRYAYERRFLKYLLWVILAGLFHQTAYFFIIVYFLFKKQDIPLKTLLGLYGVSLVVVGLKVEWIQMGARFIMSLFNLGSLSQKVTDYVFSATFADPTVSPVKILFLIVIVGYCIWYRRQILSHTMSRFIFMALLLFGIINNLMFEISEINTRITAYLIIFEVMMVAQMIQYSGFMMNKLIFRFVFILYAFAYCGVYITESRATLPYHPYQNYLIYEMFGIRSSGNQRLDQFSRGL